MNRGKGQRHELIVLLVAVGVLVVAVGLFALRSRPKAEPPPKPAPPAQTTSAQQTGEPEPGAVKPSSPDRDPFSTEPTPTRAAARPAPAPGPGPAPPPGGPPPAPPVQMTLVGVTTGHTPVAVIHKGTRKYYVKVGEKVSGYTVVRITTDRVTLKKGAASLVLPLHPPVSDEEE